jgi:hypothetical protein
MRSIAAQGRPWWLDTRRGEQEAMAPPIGRVDLAAHESCGLKPFQVNRHRRLGGLLVTNLGTEHGEIHKNLEVELSGD